MVLEVWSLDLLQPQNGASPATNDLNPEGQTLKAAHAIYNRMGIMLKSLISLTRTTPAYKLSRRQCPDSYGIFYRIYVDRPQVHTLGEGHKHVKIGQLQHDCWLAGHVRGLPHKADHFAHGCPVREQHHNAEVGSL